MARHAIDRTIDLDVNGSRLRIRLCAERERRPPLLVVQGGPGLPLLNEVRKYQRLLDLERDFLVGYCVTVVPNAGHFVHFDHPQAVRPIVANA